MAAATKVVENVFKQELKMFRIFIFLTQKNTKPEQKDGSITFEQDTLLSPNFARVLFSRVLIFAHLIFAHPEKNVFRAILIFAQLIGNIILCKKYTVKQI